MVVGMLLLLFEFVVESVDCEWMIVLFIVDVLMFLLFVCNEWD